MWNDDRFIWFNGLVYLNINDRNICWNANIIICCYFTWMWSDIRWLINMMTLYWPPTPKVTGLIAKNDLAADAATDRKTFIRKGRKYIIRSWNDEIFFRDKVQMWRRGAFLLWGWRDLFWRGSYWGCQRGLERYGW